MTGILPAGLLRPAWPVTFARRRSSYGYANERRRNNHAGPTPIHRAVRQRPGPGARLLHERPWLRAAGRRPNTRRTAVREHRRQRTGLRADSLAGDTREGRAGTGPRPRAVH